MTCIQPHLPAEPVDFIPDNNEALAQEITRLAGHINAANARFLTLLSVFIERKGWAQHGFKSAAHWLNYYCGISLGPAREKVRVALALNSLPLIREAFSKGEISYSKVRAMTRAATPANEDYLLMIARHGTASHLDILLRKYVQAEKLSQPDQGSVQTDARSLHWYTDDDGMLVFQGKLPPEEGAVFIKAMQALMQQIKEAAFQREGEAPEVEGSEYQDAEKNVPAETFSQQRADAMVRMAEHYLATGKKGAVPLAGGDKYQVIVHINAGLNAEADGGLHTLSAPAHIDNGPVLSPQVVKRLASEASLVAVLEDEKGNVLNVGRKTRTIPPAIRRALILRDKGCRFPGCCESRFVDAHHIHHWCDGGETSLDNLLLLCRRHHRQLHEEGYRIVRNAQGEPVFVSPAGRRIDQALYPQFEGKGVSAGTSLVIEGQHERLGLAIDTLTAVTAWRGESVDYGMGVEALISRAGDMETGLH